jgi:lysophospholipase L1-like esterase
MRDVARLAARRAYAGALALACAGVAMLAGASGATAEAPRVGPGARYLALGDSVTFGYQEPQVQPPPDYSKASNFKGYPEHLRTALHLRVSNAACPGETSSSFIDPSAPSYGCENYPGSPNAGYRRFFPLHVSYKGSQLSYAIGFLRKHPETRLVSLMVGANDFFLCQKTTSDGCRSKSEQQATLATVKRNVHHIVAAIRNKAEYEGQLVLVHYFSLDYNNAVITAGARSLNSTMDAAAEGFHAAHADGFGEFRRGSAHSDRNPCRAGLLTQLSSGGCGVHPSYSGQGLLALAVENVVRR